MATLDPKELFQDKFDGFVEELAEQALTPETADAVRERASRPGLLRDHLATKAWSAMNDHYADMADDLRQRAKDRF